MVTYFIKKRNLYYSIKNDIENTVIHFSHFSIKNEFVIMLTSLRISIVDKIFHFIIQIKQLN